MGRWLERSEGLECAELMSRAVAGPYGGDGWRWIPLIPMRPRRLVARRPATPCVLVFLLPSTPHLPVGIGRGRVCRMHPTCTAGLCRVVARLGPV